MAYKSWWLDEALPCFKAGKQMLVKVSYLELYNEKAAKSQSFAQQKELPNN